MYKDPFDCPQTTTIGGAAFRAIADELKKKGHTLEQVFLELLPNGAVGVFCKTDKHPKRE